MSKRRENTNKRRPVDIQQRAAYREDDSEEGSQLQSDTLEEAMGNKKEE